MSDINHTCHVKEETPCSEDKPGKVVITMSISPCTSKVDAMKQAMCDLWEQIEKKERAR